MDIWHFTWHCGLALILGTLIGIERQWTQHPAGLRTNSLVALGASMFVGLSFFVGDKDSPTRVAAQVVSGLGFLGGGVILREGLNVRGLNTAATIWCSGAVGSLAGAGYPVPAIIGAASVLFIHLALKPLVNWIDRHKMATGQGEAYYHLRAECDPAQELAVRTILLRHVGEEQGMSLHALASSSADGKVVVSAEVYSTKRNDRAIEEILARVSVEPEVRAVRWERG